MPAAPADDRGVVGNGLDGFVGAPMVARPAARKVRHLDLPAEIDIVDHLGPRELPRVAEGEPLLRIFLLPAVLDHLTEQPVVIADPVTAGRYPEACQAF